MEEGKWGSQSLHTPNLAWPQLAKSQWHEGTQALVPLTQQGDTPEQVKAWGNLPKRLPEQVLEPNLFEPSLEQRSVHCKQTIVTKNNMSEIMLVCTSVRNGCLAQCQPGPS